MASWHTAAKDKENSQECAISDGKVAAKIKRLQLWRQLKEWECQRGGQKRRHAALQTYRQQSDNVLIRDPSV